ncbi:MAG TPA: trypsin-like peptidase domain-containing protein [Candidatus Acidoferrales bacterium]|nr:trypsin-like peptidase domain-containing protein [Candidatus Acidoferrales bacterium]
MIRLLRVVALAGLGFFAALTPGPAAARAEAPAPLAGISASRRTAIVVAAQRVSPAVVTVSVMTTRVVRTDPFGGMFHDEFFDRFFPQNEYRERIPALGSGVIVDAAGLVVTNSHVIRDADQIRVNLPDGRHFDAHVLGDSPIYDLAVLKLDNASKLPVASLGNSDSLVVGEWAIAIGNPFGFLLDDPQPTVTAGVISATRRDIKSEATDTGVYKNMIQTDAAINPGNSGGALVNGDGDVIGINTFIFTQGGGSIGLGFAIPINLVKRVLGEIRRYGRVREAWPGMQVQPVTEYIARRLGWSDVSGLVVTRVEDGGPASKAGLRVGDRIVRVNGRLTNTVDDAQSSIYGAQVGDALAIEVDRDGKRETLHVTLEEAPH